MIRFDKILFWQA